ncbi:MAG: 23S rRNA (uracil(1939)-C(5))-methyltransferase RlmD [archaeon]
MTEPRCPFFGKCGGCTTQHVPYELQLENKKKLLISHIKFPEIKVFSGSEYGYRNRMDFIFHEGGLGFREKDKWWKIVDVDNCVISDEKVNGLLLELRDFFKDAEWFDVKKHTGTFRYAVVRTATEGATVSIILNEDSSRLSEAVARIKEYAGKSKAENVLGCHVPANTDQSISANHFTVKGEDYLVQNYLGKSFSYSSQGFFQNNHAMAEKMQAYVHNLLRQYRTQDYHLLDLYAGVGTFGIVNASLFKGVTILEGVKECIDSANKNIADNDVRNAKAILLDAMQLKKLDFPAELFVITDPPRSGMHEKTIEQLKKLKPQVIVYVSCNVVQLGKDLPKFKSYRIKSAALFDLFPQTPHMEAVVELVLDEESP